MKVHLNYKVKGEVVEAALCGNNDRNYKFGLKTVGPIEFRSVHDEERCKHCERIYLENRNKIRKQKGLAPVAKWNEGFEQATCTAP